MCLDIEADPVWKQDEVPWMLGDFSAEDKD